MADSPLFQLKTPHGPGLKFVAMEGVEEVARPYSYSVLAAAEPSEDVDFEALLGKPAQVTVTPPVGDKRHYHGLIAAVSYEGTIGTLRSYRLTVRPWLWLLTRGADVRIFQKMTVPDILKKVFDAYGGQHSFKLNGSYRKREYCVQYRESDFNFASRLMEEEGIFYFFVHGDGKHTLVLADSDGAHEPQQGLSELAFIDAGDPGQGVTRWRWGEHLQTGKVTVRDHSFQRPTATLEKAATAAARKHAHKDIAVYDYPAGLAPYPDEASAFGALDDESAAVAKRRLEELQSGYALADGETNSTNLCAGARFKLAKHPVARQNREYIVHATRVDMRMPGFEAGASQDARHLCHFSAVDAKVAFRPARLTPRPRVAGPHTATVVGPSGEEIHVDKHGRVKVQFHWDREGKKDADSSCFVRVAQPSAGKGWGMVFLPRIGQEVVVDFLEGDPDRPIIVGRVYNADNMPPYALPDNKTVSTVKTRSSKGGGAADFNELRFEDLKGKEYLLTRAQLDRLEIVKNTKRTLVGNEQHHIVKKDRKEKVEGEYHLTVVKDVLHKVDGKFNFKAAKDVLLATDGLHSLKAAKDITAEAGTAYSIKAGTDLHVKAGMNVGIEGGMNVHIKGGMNVVVEGGMQLTIKAGAGSVVLGPDGVSITGPLVKINSGGAAGSGSGAKPVAPTAPEDPKDPEGPNDPLSHA